MASGRRRDVFSLNPACKFHRIHLCFPPPHNPFPICFHELKVREFRAVDEVRVLYVGVQGPVIVIVYDVIVVGAQPAVFRDEALVPDELGDLRKERITGLYKHSRNWLTVLSGMKAIFLGWSLPILTVTTISSLYDCSASSVSL